MSISVYPPISPSELKNLEDESAANELSWLLDALQDTLVSLKHGLEDCYALLAPIEPGSTLVLSSPRSESVKGHVTRVGSRIVKGTIHLRLKTHPPLTLTLSPTTPLPLPALTHLRMLLNACLDAIDITRWTGDRHSAIFISSQLRLLHGLLRESLEILNGPSNTSSPGSEELESTTPFQELPWYEALVQGDTFTPPLPANLSLHIALHQQTSTLQLTIRSLEPISMQPSLGFKFAQAIGATRRLEHDEMDDTFLWRGEEVRVKEKVRLDSGVDPVVLSLGSKLMSLEGMVGWGRGVLGTVRGVGGPEAERM